MLHRIANQSESAPYMDRTYHAGLAARATMQINIDAMLQNSVFETAQSE